MQYMGNEDEEETPENLAVAIELGHKAVKRYLNRVAASNWDLDLIPKAIEILGANNPEKNFIKTIKTKAENASILAKHRGHRQKREEL